MRDPCSYAPTNGDEKHLILRDNKFGWNNDSQFANFAARINVNVACSVTAYACCAHTPFKSNHFSDTIS
jgi:hypothetical protein